jgi:hypothetical protein
MRDTKVDQLRDASRGEHDVLWLHIAMDDSVEMDVAEGRSDAANHKSNLALIQLVPNAKQ